MPSNNTNTASYGTTQSGKSKLPFYHVFSRSSKESTRSTDALVQKEPKKSNSKASTKAIYDCEHYLYTGTRGRF